MLGLPLMVNRTSNTTPTERLQQHPLLFTMNRTDCTFFLWRLHPAQPSRPSHSTILLRSESSSSKCAKLHIVTASNNRDHLRRSFYYCLFMQHIYACYSSHLSLSWWIPQSHVQRNANREVSIPNTVCEVNSLM